MKILPLAACVAGALTASPLHAQEPAATPAPKPDTRTQSEQILQNPLVRQLLQLVVQKGLELQPKGVTDGNVQTSDIVSMAKTLISNLTGASDGDVPPTAGVSGGETPGADAAANQLTGFAAYSAARFANEPGERRLDSTSRTWVTRLWTDAERARMTALFQQDYARLSATERASWEAPADGLNPALAHAWDTSLKSARLQGSGGLTTGGLTTGGLRTGTLSTARMTSGAVADTASPPRDFSMPAASSLPGSSASVAPASATAAMAPLAAANLPPPVDPDDEMRRWSARIDAQFASEQEARGAAVRAYPDLGVANSAFNTQFRARYAQYRQADPFGFLRGPGWPMKLAIFTDGDLKRQKSGTALTP